MHISIENITIYIGIISFAAAILKVLVVTPFREAIDQLKETVAQLKELLERHDARMDAQQERIAIVEQSVKMAHKRLDHMESICDAHHTQ